MYNNHINNIINVNIRRYLRITEITKKKDDKKWKRRL